MTKPEIKDSIKAFVSNFTNKNIEDDTNLFEMGFISSLFGIQLIVYIEKTFEINLVLDDIPLERLQTLENIASLITSIKEIEK
jgi:acyl carrier protein